MIKVVDQIMYYVCTYFIDLFISLLVVAFDENTKYWNDESYGIFIMHLHVLAYFMY